MKSSDAETLTLPSVGCITAFKVTRQGGREYRELILRESFTIDNELHVEETMAKKPKKTIKGKSKKGTTKKGEKAAPSTSKPPVPAVFIAPIYFPINMKLANVFGDYSSLEVGIHLPIFGDVSNFEKKVDEAMPRIVGKLQSLMNQITVGSGFGPCWSIAETPPAAQPLIQQQQGQAPQGAEQAQGQGQQGSSVTGFPPSPGQG